jgi:hypothetical protein
MTEGFRLLMLSAMYENGGNTTHRFLDGHPQMYVYPFESQIGTRLVKDNLSSMFPVKYRWPVFDLEATPRQDYRAIIDEECKVRARTPKVSKFRHMDFDFDDDERMELYVRHVERMGRSRGTNIEAFFRATFEAWKDYQATGDESIYVGYSPIIVVDTERIINDLQGVHLLHVVRNPWSAYADTKKRPVPLSLHQYMLGWTLNLYHALYYQRKYSDRVHVIRLEDILADPMKTLGALCSTLGLKSDDILQRPTWNRHELDEVYPWGTLRRVSAEINLATANELEDAEKEAIREYAWQYLQVFDYTHFLD